MASGQTLEKRPHVRTQRMKEFLETKQGKDGESVTKDLKICPEPGCDKVLTSTPGLRYHIQTHHSEGRAFTCNKCEKQFKSLNGLKYHQERTYCEGQNSTNEMIYRNDLDDSHKTQESGAAYSVYPNNMKTGPSPWVQQKSQHPLSLCLPPPAVHFQVPKPVQSQHLNKPGPSQDNSEGWLTQLAIIATGPQSPLLQKEEPKFKDQREISYGNPDRYMHSYAKPPPRSRSVSPPRLIKAHEVGSASNRFKNHSDAHVSSSSPFPVSPKSSDDEGNWSHTWPTAVWQCFIKGTRIRFTTGSKTDWQLSEDIATKESLAAKASQKANENNYAPNGLRVLHIEEVKNHSSEDNEACLRLRFSSDISGQPEIITECVLDHPFFVKEKGWCSFHPSMTAEHYGIPCSELEVNNVCLPPSHPDAIFTVDVFESFKSYDFTPMDSSAVFTLSHMAKQRREQELSPKSSPRSPTKRKSSKVDHGRAKRPMNAFMLFAKKFRMEYTQLYPGKDNRAISVLLGDKWKKLSAEDRRHYALEAKQLADQHKRMHPDCWKRKRTFSSPAVL